MSLGSTHGSALGKYRGRHRHGADGLVHCRLLMAMAAALRARKDGWRPVRHDPASVRERLAAAAVPSVSLARPVTLSALPGRRDAASAQPSLAA
jgi:hypothetical protein